jgi:hypothetical protein
MSAESAMNKLKNFGGFLSNLMFDKPAPPPADTDVKPQRGWSVPPSAGTPNVVDLAAFVNQQKIPMDPLEIQKRIDLISSPSMKKQAQINEAMLPLIQAYMAPKQAGETDMSPLMAISDIYSGTNFLDKYKNPTQKRRESLAGDIGTLGSYSKVLDAMSEREQKLLGTHILATMGTKTDTDKQVAVKGSGTGNKDEIAFSKSDEAKAVKTALQVKGTLDRYREAVKNYGYEFGGPEAARLKSLQSELLRQSKEIDKLGALQGSEIQLMLSSVPEMTGLAGLGTEAFRGGKEGTLNALNAIENRINEGINTEMDAAVAAYGHTRGFSNMANSALQQDQGIKAKKTSNKKTETIGYLNEEDSAKLKAFRDRSKNKK